MLITALLRTRQLGNYYAIERARQLIGFESVAGNLGGYRTTDCGRLFWVCKARLPPIQSTPHFCVQSVNSVCLKTEATIKVSWCDISIRSEWRLVQHAESTPCDLHTALGRNVNPKRTTQQASRELCLQGGPRWYSRFNHSLSESSTRTPRMLLSPTPKNNRTTTSSDFKKGNVVTTHTASENGGRRGWPSTPNCHTGNRHFRERSNSCTQNRSEATGYNFQSGSHVAKSISRLSTLGSISSPLAPRSHRGFTLRKSPWR